MTKEEMLNGMSEAEFYALYPTKEAWDAAQQEMAFGGSPFIQGFPFGAGVTMEEGGASFGLPYYGYFGGGGNPGDIDYTNAVKVAAQPTGSMVGPKIGDRQHYITPSQKAISTPGSTGVAPGWEAGVIKRLEAGESPEGLQKAGVFGSAGVEKYKKYYKPVYTQQPTPVTAQGTGAMAKPGIPLKDENRIDRKEIFTGNKYKTFQYPDVNAGYSQSTSRHFDPATNQEIDPGKSFDAAGNYNPSFIQGAAGAQGTVKATRINTPIGSPTDNPVTNAYSNGLRYGGLPGGAYDMPCMNCGGYMGDGGAYDYSNHDQYPMLNEGGDDTISYFKNLVHLSKKKAGGDKTVQGGNQDFLTQYRENYKKVIANNLALNAHDEESKKVLDAYQQATAPQQEQPGMPPQNGMGYQRGGINRQPFNFNQVDPQNAANQAMYEDQMNNYNARRQDVFGRVSDAFAPTKQAILSEYDPQEPLDYAQAGEEVLASPTVGESHASWAQRNNIPGGGTMANYVWDGSKWVSSNMSNTGQGQYTGSTEQYPGYTEQYRTRGDMYLPNWETSKYFPNNDIRTGYTLGKKDYARMAAQAQGSNAKVSGVKFNYGPLGRIAPKMFGPRSIEVGVTSKTKKSNPNSGPSPDSGVPVLKKGPSDYTGVNDDVSHGELFPQGVYAPGKSPQDFMSSNLYKQPTMGPVDNRSMAWEEMMAKKNNAMVPRNAFGGLNKYFTGGPERDDDTPIRRPVDYLGSGERVADAEPAREDDGYEETTNTYKYKKQTRGVGKALLKNAPLIADTITALGPDAQANREAQQRLDESHLSMNRFTSRPANGIDRGDYVTYGQGEFRPPDYVPVQFPGSVARYGGGYMQDGGVNSYTVKPDDGWFHPFDFGDRESSKSPMERNRYNQYLMQEQRHLKSLGDMVYGSSVTKGLSKLGFQEAQNMMSDYKKEYDEFIKGAGDRARKWIKDPEHKKAYLEHQKGINYKQEGGMYNEGDEVELSEEEIANLEAQGYTIERQ